MYARKLKMSESEFREYLINNYVDEDGNKVSDRVLISSEKFIQDTGLYKIDKITGLIKPCSLGNISYWKSKLDLKEYDIYKHHKYVTGKIASYVEYEDWSNKAIKGRKKNKTICVSKRAYESKNYNEKNERLLLIRVCGFPEHFENYTVEQVRQLALELWEDLGLDAREELLRVQESVITKTKRDNLREKLKVKDKRKEQLFKMIKRREQKKRKRKLIDKQIEKVVEQIYGNKK